MSRIYLRSKKSDKTSFDTQASNTIKDIVILFGIYEDYNSSLNLDKDILEYYSDVLEQKSKHDNGCFAGEYHYYNIGVSALRDLLNKNNVKTCGRRIKKLCDTYRTRPVCVPKNAPEILNILFKYIYNNNKLWHIFTNDILKKCERQTVNINHLPMDCSASILGFIYVFLNNIEKYDGYSSKSLDISNQIISTMEEIAKTYDFTNQCGSKKATVKKQLNDCDEVDN